MALRGFFYEMLHCCGVFPVSKLPEVQHSLSITDTLLLAKSGDIVLFSGASATSIGIESICDSTWSHAGIVVRTEDSVLLLESICHGDAISDVMTHKPEVGVRLVRLEDVLYTFKGNCVALRKIQCQSREELTVVRELLNRSLSSFIKNYHGRPYEKRWWEFILAQYHMCGSVRESYDSFFCTEVIAECYKDAGLLERNTGMRSNQFLPCDFCDSSNLKLCSPATIAGEIKLGRSLFIDIPQAQPDSFDSLHRYFME